MRVSECLIVFDWGRLPLMSSSVEVMLLLNNSLLLLGERERSRLTDATLRENQKKKKCSRLRVCFLLFRPSVRSRPPGPNWCLITNNILYCNKTCDTHGTGKWYQLTDTPCPLQVCPAAILNFPSLMYLLPPPSSSYSSSVVYSHVCLTALIWSSIVQMSKKVVSCLSICLMLKSCVMWVLSCWVDPTPACFILLLSLTLWVIWKHKGCDLCKQYPRD